MKKSRLFFWVSFHQLLKFSLLVLSLAAQTPAFSSGGDVVPVGILVQVACVEKHVKQWNILQQVLDFSQTNTWRSLIWWNAS